MQIKNQKQRFFIRLAIASVISLPASALVPQDMEKQQNEACINTDQITSYDIKSDTIVQFTMENGPDIIMWLKPHCAQLHFHHYLSYTPVNGRLCAGKDEIKTRAGLPCPIKAIKPLSETANPATD